MTLPLNLRLNLLSLLTICKLFIDPFELELPPDFYGYHITIDRDTFITDETLVNLDEPTNYREAMADPEAAKWKQEMDREIQSMYDNQVWTLVDQTPGRKTVGCKWIFKKKIEMDGNVQTFKARLVAKGFTQTQGIDYDETFSPVSYALL